MTAPPLPQHASRRRTLRFALAGLGLAVFLELVILSLILTWPVRLEQPALDPNIAAENSPSPLPPILPPAAEPNFPLGKNLRPGLFKPVAPLRDKPMADKTIESIKSRLALQCILPIAGQPVAYINIVGLGLKPCRVGDTVEDLFTVLDIAPNSVQLSVLDHKILLTM